jgi:hypothetical protein
MASSSKCPGSPDRYCWSLRLAAAVISVLFCNPLQAPAQVDNPNPPEAVVRLIFIHHSTGENWLSDSDGGLGRALSDNNYFVSDTNYGWGPHGIGNATDIPNWLDWFRSDNTPLYTTALYRETDQRAPYTRTLPNPGGENRIIMFKSCFPNSNLEGSPHDPPAPEGWLSVSNAKYTYNEILQYFATRPDKLFIVITAPPLSDTANAANARAFNQWLVHDWLAENHYPYDNVAVWDFYNVLTAPDNHHQFIDRRVEHVINTASNTLHYPSGDDHPSQAGNRKATEEFVPILNVFYHRWSAGAPALPPDHEEPDEGEEPPPTPDQLVPGDFIDRFDAGRLPNSDGWAVYWDEGSPTRIEYSYDDQTARGSGQALRLDFEVVAGSWATAALTYTSPQDFSASAGLLFYLHADRAGIPCELMIYRGASGFEESYTAPFTTTPESVDGWARIEVPWSRIARVSWEENAGTPLDPPTQVTGVGFGLVGLDSNANLGTIWIDDLQLADVVPPTAVEAESAGLPGVFALAQNYPNPFNARTTIPYRLAQAGAVRLTLYNLLGQPLRTLIDEVQQAGFHQIIWDGRDEVGHPVASGVYLYRLQAGTEVQLRRAVMLK